VKAQENKRSTQVSIPIPISALIGIQLISSFSGSLQYSIKSPENTIYDINEVPIDISIRTTNGFRFGYSNYVNEIFYSLDGKANVTILFTYTITGNEEIEHYNYRASTVLKDLSEGDHNIKVYAADSYPFTLESIDFAIGYSLKTPEPTPSPSYPTPTPTSQPPPIRFSDPTTIILGTIVILAIVGILAYFKKYKK
jgi:hypothetical protein